MNAYEHTQTAPLHWLLCPPGGLLLTAAWLNRGQVPLALILFGAAVFLLALGFGP